MPAIVALVLAVAPARADVLSEVRALAPYRAMRKAAAPHIPDDAYRKAAAGGIATGIEIVEGVAAGKGWGVAVFDVPPEIVWKAVNNEEAFPEIDMPVDVSVVLRGTPHHSPRTIFQHMPLPLVDDRWWITELRHNRELYEASGHRMMELYWYDRNDRSLLDGTRWSSLADDGTPVAFAKGSWLVVALSDGRSLVEYYVWSDPGGMLPAGAASRFAAGAVDDTLEAMRRLAERHRRSPQPGYVLPDGSPVP